MKIQCVISGFGGKPATVYSLYDEKSGMLVIQKEGVYRDTRFDDCLIISNTDLADREVLFDQDKFSHAIERFFELENSGALEFGKNAQRCSPTNAIEVEGVRDSGARIYRLQPQITNAQIAALATCWYIKQARTIAKVFDMQDRLLAIQQGRVLTI